MRSFSLLPVCSQTQTLFHEIDMLLLSAREQTHYVANIPIPCFHIGLKDCIDQQALNDAIHRAVLLHPLFGMNIVKGNSGLFEFVPFSPASFDNEHHRIWSINCSERTIRFDATHALTDASGVLRFLNDVLAYYLRSIGYPEIPEPTPNPVNFDLSSPLERLTNQSIPPIGIPNFGPPALTNERFFDMDAPRAKSQHISLSFSEFKKYANICETTVFSVVSGYLARAYQQAFQLNSGNIKIRVAANLRPQLHIDTPRNFSMGFPLNYAIERMNKLDNEKIFAAFRSQLDIFLEEGNLLKKCKSEHNHMAELLQNPNKLHEQATFYRNYSSQPLAYISYTHIKPSFIPEVQAHIDTFEWQHSTFLPKWLFVVCGTSHQDKIDLNISEYTKDNALSKAFENAVKNDGFSCITSSANYPITNH